jgi:hypothetical protein
MSLEEAIWAALEQSQIIPVLLFGFENEYGYVAKEKLCATSFSMEFPESFIHFIWNYLASISY